MKKPTFDQERGHNRGDHHLSIQRKWPYVKLQEINTSHRLSAQITGNPCKEPLPDILDQLSRDAVAVFRLTLGHDCATKHLHRTGIYAELSCVICNHGEEIDRHHLQHCLTLKSNKLCERCWETRCVIRLLGQKWNSTYPSLQIISLDSMTWDIRVLSSRHRYSDRP